MKSFQTAQGLDADGIVGPNTWTKLLKVIIIVSIVMWYIIDRAKTLWGELPKGKYITIAVAAVLAFALCFGYRLDLMVALGVVPTTSIIGIMLTALALMGGSSGLDKLLDKLKK